MARKVGHYLKNNKTKHYEEKEDPDLFLRTLEFVSKYGSMASLLKSVQSFIANHCLALINRVLRIGEVNHIDIK